MLLVMDLFFPCLNLLNNMDPTITYFLPIPTTERHTKTRSELLNTPFVPTRIKAYTRLPVSTVGNLLG